MPLFNGICENAANRVEHSPGHALSRRRYLSPKTVFFPPPAWNPIDGTVLALLRTEPIMVQP
jgi:hypothetical protein